MEHMSRNLAKIMSDDVITSMYGDTKKTFMLVFFN